MNILGIDYGAKRIGLAWTDTAMGVVLPYGVIEMKKLETGNWKLGKLIELVQKEKIDRVIVGLPIGLDGKENENTKAVHEFIGKLKSEVRVPIATVDERFTSAQADRMEGAGASRDEKAAMIILQSYLDGL